MDSTYFLAQVLGIVIFIMSLGLAFQEHYYQGAFHELMSQPGLKFMTGITTLIIGTLLILTHDDWQTRWGIFIGVLCWAIFIKGCMRILIPKVSDRMVLKCIDRREYVIVSVVLGIIMGLALIYHGFFN
jgi:hypothetical protein